MSVMIRTAVLVAALAAAACGATTRDNTPNTPTSTPPETSRVSTTPTDTGPTEVNTSQTGTVPAGQELDIRLQNTLSSETATTEQRFEGTTVVDLTQGGTVLIPAGSTVRGFVSGVKKAGRIDREGSLTLSFDRITVRGREMDIRGTATQVFESRGIREEAGTAGVGAGVGGVIGGIIGGLKGAIVGAVIGAGGAIVATDGKDITLPAGSIVRIRLDSAVNVR
jgi:hypothetical protein